MTFFCVVEENKYTGRCLALVIIFHTTGVILNWQWMYSRLAGAPCAPHPHPQAYCISTSPCKPTLTSSIWQGMFNEKVYSSFSFFFSPPFFSSLFYHNDSQPQAEFVTVYNNIALHRRITKLTFFFIKTVIHISSEVKQWLENHFSLRICVNVDTFWLLPQLGYCAVLKTVK